MSAAPTDPPQPPASATGCHCKDRAARRPARGTRRERPTPPTECHAPVTHSPTSVIGWMAQEHEPNSADRRFAAIRLSKDSITRWPDHPISRSLAPAGTHSPISVIGGFDARDEANSVARDKRLDPSPVPPRLVKTPAAVHPLPSERAMNFRLGLMKRSPDLRINRSLAPAGPHSPASVIGRLR